MRLNKSSKDEKLGFRGTTASASTTLNAPASPGGSNHSNIRRPFKHPSTANTTSSQRVVALFQDVKRYIRQQQRHRRSSEGGALPLHQKFNKAPNSSSSISSSKAWHVDIPKRMILSTMLVFLLLPLTIFYWKETHLHSQDAVAVESKALGYHDHTMNGGTTDVFPNWFADLPGAQASSSSSQDEGDPQINNPQRVVPNDAVVAAEGTEGTKPEATLAQQSPLDSNTAAANTADAPESLFDGNTNTTDLVNGDESLIVQQPQSFNDTIILTADVAVNEGDPVVAETVKNNPPGDTEVAAR